MKTPDQNDLKLGTLVVVFDSLSMPVDFGIKRSSVRGTGCARLRIFKLLTNSP